MGFLIFLVLFEHVSSATKAQWTFPGCHCDTLNTIDSMLLVYDKRFRKQKESA